jgi:hypothetical protein
MGARTIISYMKIFFNLSRFIARDHAGPDPMVPDNAELLRDSSRSAHLLLIGLRSPGDQLQVVAIKPCQLNELGRVVQI